MFIQPPAVHEAPADISVNVKYPENKIPIKDIIEIVLKAIFDSIIF